MKVYQGQLAAPSGAKFAVLVSRFNEFVTGKLLDGCIDALTRHGAKPDDIEVVWSPGSFEIPVLARRLAAAGRYAAVICLGAIIRGQTDHHQHIASQVAKGVAAAGMETGVPCIFGILTCDTLEQAIDRAGAKAGNKGSDAAVSAIEMANLICQLPADKKSTK